MSIAGFDDPQAVAVIVATVFVAGFLRGFVGFGGAMVVVPVLALTIGPREAVAVAVLVGLPATVHLLPTAVRLAERPVVVPVALAVLLSTPVGVWILVAIDPSVMKIVIAALVIGMVGFLAHGWTLAHHVPRAVLVAAGIAGGLIQGSAGIGGPPVVAVALSRAGSAELQRANVIAVMTAISFASVVPLALHGLLGLEVLVLGVALMPIGLASTWVGARYFSHHGHRWFRRAALALLAGIGVVTLVLALQSYLSAAR